MIWLLILTLVVVGIALGVIVHPLLALICLVGLVLVVRALHDGGSRV